MLIQKMQFVFKCESDCITRIQNNGQKRTVMLNLFTSDVLFLWLRHCHHYRAF